MKLKFCIMVSLQVLLVNIIKIMKSGKFKNFVQLGKRPMSMFDLVNCDSWVVVDIL
jgi:hypothetical protein